jgi:hypothetical protein
MVVARSSSVRSKKPGVTTTIVGGVLIARTRLDVVHVSMPPLVSMPAFPMVISPFDVPAIASVTVAMAVAPFFAMPTTATTVVIGIIARIVIAATVTVTTIAALGHEGGLDCALIWLVGGHGIVLCHCGGVRGQGMIRTVRFLCCGLA